MSCNDLNGGEGWDGGGDPPDSRNYEVAVLSEEAPGPSLPPPL